MTPDYVIPAGAILGEGIQWHDGRLWWTDIQGKTLGTWDWASRALHSVPLPERLGSFALTSRDSLLLCAFETGFATFEPDTAALNWVSRIEAPASGIRFNDGRVDRRGRFWAGTMIEDESTAGARRGALYCLDPVSGPQRTVTDVTISNGLAWSPDGRWMYFADSPTRAIWRFAVDAETGMPGSSSVFAQTPEGIYPDGATVDAEGCYWSAQWGGSRVVRYTPDGAIERIIPVPVSQPSCVCFGGDSLDFVCVTTARDGLDTDQLRAEPLAGDILIYKTDICGIKEDIVQLNNYNLT